MLKYFLNKFEMFFDPENLKKTLSKVAHNRPPMFFFSTAKNSPVCPGS
jgi:hypothetical protein